MEYLRKVWGYSTSTPSEGQIEKSALFFIIGEQMNQYQYPHSTPYDSLAKTLYLSFTDFQLTKRNKFDKLPIKDKDYWRALAEISKRENLWKT